MMAKEVNMKSNFQTNEKLAKILEGSFDKSDDKEKVEMSHSDDEE